MSKAKTESLPLFLHRGDFCVYVIDDKLIGFEKNVGEDNTPFRAFNLLLELYENEITYKAIPEDFYEIFNPASKIGLDYCLLGKMGQNFFSYCLNFSMEINKKKKPVIFSDFYLYVSTSQRERLVDLKVYMSDKEAFHTLANICVTGCYQDFSTIDRYSSEEMFEKLLSDSSYGEKLHTYPSNVIYACKFSINYVNYIKQQLLGKKIKPEKLLQQSGAFLLALLADLEIVQEFISKIMNKIANEKVSSKNEKIQYFTLLNLVKKEPTYSKIKEFIAKNKEKFLQMENELLKPFPDFWRYH
jgi:hypothetical protein